MTRAGADDALTRTDLPLPNRRSGKVRDLYDLPPGPGGVGRTLIVATDRLSAFDVVLPTPIPGKGRLLTELSRRWFGFVEARGLCRTHTLPDDPHALDALPEADRAALGGRAVVARRCRVIPVECVVRGYLEGSGWRDYRANGSVCGVALPPGLRQADRLPEPIFTPATKEEGGRHDENISFADAAARVGAETMAFLRDRSLAIYAAAAEHALSRGLILADTKFEFGVPVDDEGAGPVLIDEALTPDSSRYWPADAWSPGREQSSFDKQFVREYLQRLVDEGAWDKRAPGPELPPGVVSGTRERYAEALRRLFGDA